MTESDRNIRDSLLSTLKFLSSTDEQRSFAEEVRYEDYEGEFACWWFDTFYPDEPRSSVMFDVEQLAALREFTATFEASHLALGRQSFSINQLLARGEWQTLMTKARDTLHAVSRAP